MHLARTAVLRLLRVSTDAFPAALCIYRTLLTQPGVLCSLKQSPRWQPGCPRSQAWRRWDPAVWVLSGCIIAAGTDGNGPLQVAMSRFEPEEYINDRYKAIEDRLAVRHSLACSGQQPQSSDMLTDPWCCSADCSPAAEQASDIGRESELVCNATSRLSWRHSCPHFMSDNIDAFICCVEARAAAPPAKVVAGSVLTRTAQQQLQRLMCWIMQNCVLLAALLFSTAQHLLIVRVSMADSICSGLHQLQGI